MSRSRPQDAFTLIELMIVVAIIGILASIASSEFYHMLMRARRAETVVMLDGIRTAEHAYMHEWEVYTSCVAQPPVVPGRTQVVFPATIFTSLDWNLLGWVPDSHVYGQYGVLAPTADTFIADGYTDIDGDSVLAHTQATQASKPQMITNNLTY